MKVLYIGVFQILHQAKDPKLGYRRGYRCASTYDFVGQVNRGYRGDAAHIVHLAVEKACGSDEVQKENDAIITIDGKEDNSQSLVDWSKYRFFFRTRKEGIVACVVTDKEYPLRVAQGLAARVAGDFCDKYPRSAFENMDPKSTDAFPLPEINTYISQYQDPESADPIARIQKELDETKQTMHHNIQLVLDRGESLASLATKSEEISASTKLFLRHAKKQNSCCSVM